MSLVDGCLVLRDVLVGGCGGGGEGGDGGMSEVDVGDDKGVFGIVDFGMCVGSNEGDS